jgi:hypothetical protein
MWCGLINDEEGARQMKKGTAKKGKRPAVKNKTKTKQQG